MNSHFFSGCSHPAMHYYKPSPGFLMTPRVLRCPGVFLQLRRSAKISGKKRKRFRRVYCESNGNPTRATLGGVSTISTAVPAPSALLVPRARGFHVFGTHCTPMPPPFPKKMTNAGLRNWKCLPGTALISKLLCCLVHDFFYYDYDYAALFVEVAGP